MTLSLSNSLQIGTTVLQSPRDRGARDAEFISPIGYALGASIPCDEPRVSPVALLFSPTRPSAVFWTVVSVWVNAINRVSLWAWTHVLKKVLKGIPSLADLDTSTAIVGVVGKLRVVATASHRKPHSVQRMSASAPSMTVFNWISHSGTMLRRKSGSQNHPKLKQLPQA